LFILRGVSEVPGAVTPDLLSAAQQLEQQLIMSINVQDHFQATVVEIKGKFLGSVDGQEFKQKLDDLKKSGKTNIVVDLGKTDFMDSSGIGALISGLTSLRKAGGDVRLANMEKRIKNLFLITRLLGSVFDDYESVESAAESYRTNPPEPAKSTS
jgi:anti-sigma B factor antagonist